MYLELRAKKNDHVEIKFGKKGRYTFTIEMDGSVIIHKSSTNETLFEGTSQEFIEFLTAEPKVKADTSPPKFNPWAGAVTTITNDAPKTETAF